MNYYDVLGVPQSASHEEIRSAYLAQIKYFHPDVFPGNPEIAKFKTLQLNEAYSVLSNPEHRSLYDWMLKRKAADAKASTPPPPPPSSGTTGKPPSPGSNPRTTSVKDTMENIKLVVGILVICVFSAILVFTMSESSRDTMEASVGQEKNDPMTEYQPVEYPEYDYIPMTLPENGQIFYENGWDRVAPFSVVTRGEDNFFVKLKNTSGTEDVLTFFVRAGETVDIDVPLGNYTLYYATGKTWYGESVLFGESTIYSKADDLFDFYESDGYVNGWTVELYMQSNGNLSTKSIDPSEF